MSEKERELIAMVLEESGLFSKNRSKTISSYFDDLDQFIDSTEEEIRSLSYISKKRVLKDEEVINLLKVKRGKVIDKEKPLADNFITVISRNFIRRQVSMLRKMSLDSMNPNPFLIQSLNLSTPKEVVRINAYASATRSIVTSFGLIVQNMLGNTSDSVEKGFDGWDLLKIDGDGKKHWMQVKSGPNDMDKDQIEFWSDKIDKVHGQGDKGYIGMTYGKRDNDTVTLGLLKKYLINWESKTLIGRELWDFLSDDPQLHTRVLSILREQASAVLRGNDIIVELEDCVQRITGEFISKYGDGADGVRNYINDIF